MKPLGGDRYQIGAVVVDKGARRFSVPARVLVLGKPLEYLATAPGGMKAYETLLEVDTTGSEFNLACILIGLERDPKLGPVNRNNQTPLPGRRIALSIAWSDGGKRRQISAAEAILNPEAGVKPDAVEWVYTGAVPSDPSAGFVPDLTGTLIGFVHDPNCIIDSVVGVGVGAYGTVRGSSLMPPVGSAVELIVDAAPVAK
ncbi:MAG: YdjY domain-containing protein [Caldimonas sp.]